MRRSEDAIRSVGKYLAFALGDEWEVRFSGEDGVFVTPFCLVTWSGPTTYAGTREFPVATRPLHIDCYPNMKKLTTVETAYMAAEAVEELLFQAFRVGKGEAHPERVPFYDYENVPLTATSDARHPSDYIRLVPGSFNLDRVIDPQDERWVRVIAEMRLTWIRVGTQILGKSVESVQHRVVGS